MSGLRIENLSVSYRDRGVIENLTLPVLPRSSVVAVLGPNAAGKSTLLKALAGLQPSNGEIRLHGENLNRMDANLRQHRVGYLPQALPLASGLLAYELVLGAAHAAGGGGGPGRAERESRVEAVIREFGLETLAFRRVSELSGGRRQLVGIAQVLVRRPQLLLLDEPTSALDLRWQLEVLARVAAYARSEHAIALVALHDLNLALRFCDWTVLLTDGRALACGPMNEAITPEALARAYGVPVRIERCSQGHPMVITGGAPGSGRAD